MIPEPLHPAIVHFPIVLAVLLPVAALSAVVVIRRGASPRPAWSPVVAVGAALVLSAWIALQTGEREEDRVESVVAGSIIHEHEERAEFFLPLTLVSFLLAGGGLLPNRPGRLLRGAALVVALGTAGAAYRVGHSGGELVYRHGAAAAWSGIDAGSGLELEEHQLDR